MRSLKKKKNSYIGLPNRQTIEVQYVQSTAKWKSYSVTIETEFQLEREENGALDQNRKLAKKHSAGELN